MTAHICEKCRKEIRGLKSQWRPRELFWHDLCWKIARR